MLLITASGVSITGCKLRSVRVRMSCAFSVIPTDVGTIEFVPSTDSDANLMFLFGRYLKLLTNQMINSTQYTNFMKL